MTTTATTQRAEAGRRRPPANGGKAAASRALVPAPRPRTMAEVCFAAARDKSIDVAKMDALMQFVTKREWMVAMLAVQKDLPRIVKTAWNPHTKSKYARLEDVLKEIEPVLTKHNMVLTFGMADSPKEDHYRIICDVMHAAPEPAISGHTRQYFVDIGADVAGAKGGGTKSLAQGSGSSISYGRRYLLGLIFNLAMVGEDKDGAGGQQAVITGDQLAELEALLKHKHAPSLGKFFQAFHVGAVEQLPAARFEEARKRVKDRIAKFENVEGKA